MTPALRVLDDTPVRPGPTGSGGPPASNGGDEGGPFGPAGGGALVVPPPATATIGAWLLVGAVVILFASFTSTMVVRRAEADWRLGPLPPLLWLNSAVLVASSLVLEWARRRGHRGHMGRLRLGLGLAAVLGAAFLTGQWVAWRQLTGSGVSMASSPHSAFFYLLTGTHAVHVAGGVGALLYLWWRARGADRVADLAGVVAPAAIYWHFVDVLWLYVFVVLFM